MIEYISVYIVQMYLTMSETPGKRQITYCDIFAEGKNYEASRDSCYRVTASQTSMFPRQQSDKTLMGSGVFYAVRAEML
jgi:hypothetical protein